MLKLIILNCLRKFIVEYQLRGKQKLCDNLSLIKPNSDFSCFLFWTFFFFPSHLNSPGSHYSRLGISLFRCGSKTNVVAKQAQFWERTQQKLQNDWTPTWCAEQTAEHHTSSPKSGNQFSLVRTYPCFLFLQDRS